MEEKQKIFGYARRSTREQNEDRQIIALKEMGVSGYLNGISVIMGIVRMGICADFLFFIYLNGDLRYSHIL